MHAAFVLITFYNFVQMAFICPCTDSITELGFLGGAINRRVLTLGSVHPPVLGEGVPVLKTAARNYEGKKKRGRKY